ncbi:MAG: metal ABC transporter ATP-binding protein [Rhizobiales bacterium]|nr:metal ABC transporter ATP-binding protein [Hyphomicrobiales bacterium]
MVGDRVSALAFQDLTLAYGANPVVQGLTGRVEPGALLAIVGPNGAGKSSLLKAAMGELEPVSGALALGVRRAQIAYLPQAVEIDLSFPLTVYDFVAMGLWREIGAWRSVGAPERARIADALSDVGLEGFEARPIAALSGGQRQRMFFARLALQRARLILLDEPFAAVDERTTGDLIQLIEGWRAAGCTVVAVLHDLALVRARFPDTLLLARRMIAWGPTDVVLTERNLSRAAAMVEAEARAPHESASAAGRGAA